MVQPDKGYGFITEDDGRDVFRVLQRDTGEGYQNLEENQKVESDVTGGPKAPRRQTWAPWRNDRKAVPRDPSRTWRVPRFGISAPGGGPSKGGLQDR
ncbi:MAG: cold shock domain-containing protein [Actinomycetota bacterium]